MKRIVTKGIVLTRTDYGEADRILTMLTPDHGKVRLIAKGVRKVKSKLAGGIELFSISQITFIAGRSEIKTLVSSRLQTYFDNIVKDINRTMLGYDFIKVINRATEDGAEKDYFELLIDTLEGLNDPTLSAETLQLWFNMRLLKLSGHTPNLYTSIDEQPLEQDKYYEFDHEKMLFHVSSDGKLNDNHIKLLRLVVRSNKPGILNKVQDLDKFLPELLSLSATLLSSQIRL